MGLLVVGSEGYPLATSRAGPDVLFSDAYRRSAIDSRQFEDALLARLVVPEATA